MALQNNEWVSPQELAIREFNNIRGRLCSVVEALALPEKQERATIALVKQLHYNSQEVVGQLLAHAVPMEVRYNDHKVEARDV